MRILPQSTKHALSYQPLTPSIPVWPSSEKGSSEPIGHLSSHAHMYVLHCTFQLIMSSSPYNSADVSASWDAVFGCYTRLIRLFLGNVMNFSLVY